MVSGITTKKLIGPVAGDHNGMMFCSFPANQMGRDKRKIVVGFAVVLHHGLVFRDKIFLINDFVNVLNIEMPGRDRRISRFIKLVMDEPRCECFELLICTFQKVYGSSGVDAPRSEERRVGEECRSRRSRYE